MRKKSTSNQRKARNRNWRLAQITGMISSMEEIKRNTTNPFIRAEIPKVITKLTYFHLMIKDSNTSDWIDNEQ